MSKKKIVTESFSYEHEKITLTSLLKGCGAIGHHAPTYSEPSQAITLLIHYYWYWTFAKTVSWYHFQNWYILFRAKRIKSVYKFLLNKKNYSYSIYFNLRTAYIFLNEYLANLSKFMRFTILYLKERKSIDKFVIKY